jgi:hypothetical protein
MLVALLRRDDAGGRLMFIPSEAAGVRRVMEITGLEGRLPLLDGAPPRYSADERPSDDPLPAS